MKSVWKTFVAVLMAVMMVGLGVQSAQAGGVPPIGGGGGGGGGSGGGLPGNWNMSSGSSRSEELSSAWANINGPTMGIPDSVSANMNWGSYGGKEGEGINFTLNFSASGDVETPTEATNLGASLRLTTNSVTTQPFEGPDGQQWYIINYDRELFIDGNANYLSWLWENGDGATRANGSFNMNVSASPVIQLSADPSIEFNSWDDLEQPEPPWFNDYDAFGRVYGYIPAGNFTATVVPEPATMLLVGIGASAPFFRRSRRERLEHNPIG